MNPKATEWINRYSAEVARMLPAERRADIEMEIRSLLLDEAEASTSSDSFSEADALALLKRYPSPQQMAARYGATQYLIGPALYPSYLLVLRIVSTIITVVLVASLLVAAFVGNGTPSILGSVLSIFQALVISGGIVTAVFALVERTASADELRREVAGWNPKSLPAASPAGQVKLSDLFTGIVTSLVTILWLTLFVDGDGAIRIANGGPTVMKLFTPFFMGFLPWLIAAWTGELLVQLVVLARRRWDALARWLMVLFGIVGAVLLGRMLTGSALSVQPQFERIVDGFVFVALLVTLVEMAKHLWVLVRDRGSRAKVGVPGTVIR